MPVYIEALEGVSDGVFYVGDMEHYYEVGDSMTEDEEKYEKPDVTQIVHALIIYGLVVFIGFFLLIVLANKPEQVKDTVKVEVVK